jgi:hypothetical protein
MAFADVLSRRSGRHVSPDDLSFICTTCANALKKDKLPSISKHNNMQLHPIPPELAGLNVMEMRLISQASAWVCEKERQRERERDAERERDRQTDIS